MLSFKQYLLEEENITKILDGDTSHKFEDKLDFVRVVERLGGKLLGSGFYGRAFSHPSLGEDKVIKIFENHDECYIKFARYAYANPHKHLPRFYTKPRKFIPPWKRSSPDSFQYYVIMEKLEKLDHLKYFAMEDLAEDVTLIAKKKKTLDELYAKPKEGETNGTTERQQWIIDLQRDIEFLEEEVERVTTNHPNYMEFIRFKALLENGYIPVVGQKLDSWGMPAQTRCQLDLHAGNIMVRGDDFVIIDPYASFNENFSLRKARAPRRDGNRYEARQDGLAAGKRYAPRKKKKKSTNFPSK